MTWSIQPSALLFFLLCYFTGNLSMYGIVFVSLLWHECGHILLAYAQGVKVKQCKIALYGGELTFQDSHTISAKQLLWIACGGPIATIFLICSYFILPSVLAESVLKVQLLLLSVNLMPIWPFDGGRIVYYTFMIYFGKNTFYERFLSLSICFITIIIVIALLLLPKSWPLMVIASIINIRLIAEWRSRKYRTAFEKIVVKRLT